MTDQRLDAEAELKHQIDEGARLLETARAVAEGCMALIDPVELPKSTDGAFTILLKNQDSPYGQTYLPGHEDRERAYLKGLGYHSNTIRHAIYNAHDCDPQFHTPWDNPHYGITARESPGERQWRRTASITIEKPAYVRLAAEKGWGYFDEKHKQAALLLLLKMAEITPDHVASIQANLDAWE